MHCEWQVSALGTDQFSSDEHRNKAQQLTGLEKPSLGELGVFFYIYNSLIFPLLQEMSNRKLNSASTMALDFSASICSIWQVFTYKREIHN